jgi:hypothetical protein
MKRHSLRLDPCTPSHLNTPVGETLLDLVVFRLAPLQSTPHHREGSTKLTAGSDTLLL